MSAALGLGLSDFRVPFFDQCEVARPEIEEGPVNPDVEVGAAREVTHQRRDEITAAAEHAAAESKPEGGQQWTADFLLVASLGLADGGGAGKQIGAAARSALTWIRSGWGVSRSQSR